MEANSRREVITAFGVGAVTALAGCSDSTEDEYPSESITHASPYDPGGGNDTYARGVMPLVADQLDTAIEIENISGAGGMNAISEVISADPDGHTTIGIDPPTEVGVQIMEGVDIDQRDLEAVCTFGFSARVLVVDTEYEDEVESFTDVLEKYESGEWENVGLQSPGSPPNIFALLAKHEDSEYDWQYEEGVSYGGSAAINEAVASGEVPCGISSDAGAISSVEAGDVFPLVSLHSDGSPAFPDIPDVTEEGYPEFDWVNGINRTLFAPPETPRDVRETLADAVENAIETEEAQEWVEETDNPLIFNGIDETQQLLEDIFDQYHSFEVAELIEDHA